nr:SpoIIE family protein phosphatase [Deinobacterium chartae]
MVVDGLGHGLAAHAAAESAERAFAGLVSRDPASGMMALHRLLRATRGAVAALAEVDLQAGRVRLAGVGNIHTVMVRPDGQRIFPNQNGTLGQQVPEPREFALPWPQGSALIMHSDGLRGSWNLARYPGLLHRRAALIAGVLYRDFVRGRDDATVVVLKEGGAR